MRFSMLMGTRGMAGPAVHVVLAYLLTYLIISSDRGWWWGWYLAEAKATAAHNKSNFIF